MTFDANKNEAVQHLSHLSTISQTMIIAVARIFFYRNSVLVEKYWQFSKAVWQAFK